jgi:hypothetical protein
LNIYQRSNNPKNVKNIVLKKVKMKWSLPGGTAAIRDKTFEGRRQRRMKA